MLLLEWRGEPYNKSANRRALARLLNKRSDSSIEMKFRNVSAILLAYGIPPIFGYKPLVNFQHGLEEAVVGAIAEIKDFSTLAIGAVTVTKTRAIPGLQPTEAPLISTLWRAAALRRSVLTPDLTAVESRSEALHSLALRAVAQYERNALLSLDREDLAAAVAIREIDVRTGNGIVVSKFPSGAEKSIVVKPTNSIAEFPFIVTADEVDLSSDPSVGFQLYRVFGMRHRPGFYILKGNLRSSAQLTTSSYSALPRS